MNGPRKLRYFATLASCALLISAATAPLVGLQQGQPTIWDGVFTDGQAERGQQTYKKSCALCHKDDLLGDGPAPALVGADFLNRFNKSTVDDVVQTVRASMPQDAPDSLGTAAYVDLVAYLIKANAGPAGATELPAEREKLKQILVTGR